MGVSREGEVKTSRSGGVERFRAMSEQKLKVSIGRTLSDRVIDTALQEGRVVLTQSSGIVDAGDEQFCTIDVEHTAFIDQQRSLAVFVDLHGGVAAAVDLCLLYTSDAADE